MGTQYLSNVLFRSDIAAAPTNDICIISGVGSGKNHFIEHELIKDGNILYISSRRAKVNEILEDKIAQEYITWDKEEEDIVTTTNYGIEKLVMNEKFGDRISDVINHFSFIVVDEAHSIFTDATYADSSFHVYRFLRYVRRNYPCMKIILMTGTPEPLQYFKKFLQNFTIFDKRESCINLVPKKIQFVKKQQAIELMASIPSNEKTIYYSNSAKKIVHGKYNLFNQLVTNGTNKSEICICMSDNSASENQKYFSGLKELCEKTKNSITQSRTLPEGTRFLLTTSTLKEGVNIEDTSIKIAFCETHLLSDIQQFAGRVRTSIDTLYIVLDSLQHDVNTKTFKSYMLDASFSKKHILPVCNTYLNDEIKNTSSSVYTAFGYDPGDIELDFLFEGDLSIYTYGGDAVKAFIKLIEAKHPYIRFDHLTGTFKYFNTRFIEQKRVHSAICHKEWVDDLYEYCQKNDITYTPPTFEDEIDISTIKEYLSERIGLKLVDKDNDDLKTFLASAFHLNSSNPQYRTLTSKLEAFELPFEISRGNTTVNGVNKRYLQINEIV